MKEFVLVSSVWGSYVIGFFALVILYGIFFEIIPGWWRILSNKARAELASTQEYNRDDSNIANQ